MHKKKEVFALVTKIECTPDVTPKIKHMSTRLVILLYLQGKQKQAKRTKTFFQFCNAKEAILLCTDVAARGLDIPEVDWIVQFDPPDDPKVRRLNA